MRPPTHLLLPPGIVAAVLALAGGLTGLRAASVEARHRTLDHGGGRLSAPGVVVDASAGGWESVLRPASGADLRLQGGFPGVLNEPPLLPDQVWTRPRGLTVKRPVAGLLATAVDPEADPLQWAGHGPATGGGLLQLQEGWLLYVPPPQGGDDQWPWWVEDAAGNRASGTVLVVEGEPPPAPAANQLTPPRPLPGGRWLLRFLGLPGRSYRLEFAPEPTGPWMPVPGVPSPWVAPPDGLLEAVDDGRGSAARFYRMVAW